MERLDSAATGLIEQDVRGRFPDGAVDSVAVLQYGDDPSVEPGQIVIQVTVASAAEAEGDEDPRDSTGPTETRSGSSSRTSRSGDLTPVMARLGPARPETLDTLIAAGFAANRAQAVRWALARIRERPAYTELPERARNRDLSHAALA